MTTDAAIRAALEPRIRKVGVSACAEMIGWQAPNLSAWLAGSRSIPPARLDALCEALGVEPRVRYVRRTEPR